LYFLHFSFFLASPVAIRDLAVSAHGDEPAVPVGDAVVVAVWGRYGGPACAIRGIRGSFVCHGDESLGRNIKILRAKQGLSQADLAEKADISITFLSNIERGIKFPLPEILSKLANSLGIEVNQLFITDLNSNQDKVLSNQISEDFTKDVNTAMEKVIKRYLGLSFMLR